MTSDGKRTVQPKRNEWGYPDTYDPDIYNDNNPENGGSEDWPPPPVPKNYVNNASLQEKSVDYRTLADDSVGFHQLQNDSVFGGIIPTGGISQGHLGLHAVGAFALDDNAIYERSIMDGNVTNSKIASNAINMDKLDKSLQNALSKYEEFFKVNIVHSEQTDVISIKMSSVDYRWIDIKSLWSPYPLNVTVPSNGAIMVITSATTTSPESGSCRVRAMIKTADNKEMPGMGVGGTRVCAGSSTTILSNLEAGSTLRINPQRIMSVVGDYTISYGRISVHPVIGVAQGFEPLTFAGNEELYYGGKENKNAK